MDIAAARLKIYMVNWCRENWMIWWSNLSATLDMQRGDRYGMKSEDVSLYNLQPNTNFSPNLEPSYPDIEWTNLKSKINWKKLFFLKKRGYFYFLLPVLWIHKIQTATVMMFLVEQCFYLLSSLTQVCFWTGCSRKSETLTSFKFTISFFVLVYWRQIENFQRFIWAHCAASLSFLNLIARFFLGKFY